MKEVYIISTGQIIKGKTAGSQRVMNSAKSLAAGNVNVYLCSLTNIKSDLIESVELFPGISYLQSIDNKENSSSYLISFIRCVGRFIKERNSESVIYLYPTTFVGKDFVYLLYFKVFKGYKFYCDINELRVTNAFVSTPPQRILPKFYFYLKSVYDFLAYKLSEIQVLFYDGIVVISTNLENYFSKKAKRIMRVPILCDLTKKREEKPVIQFDNTVFRICFAGYIKCDKEGFDILFEALYKVNIKKNVELYLYGILCEEDRDILDHLAEIFMLKRKIYYMGNIDPDDLLREFSKYHLLILPRPLIRQTTYGFSTKLSEYLISGVPVLVTDVSDNSIYIKDKHNGFIIPPGSLSAMVDKLMWIMENYNDYSSAIVENAYRTALEKFDYKLYTQSYINFFFHN